MKQGRVPCLVWVNPSERNLRSISAALTAVAGFVLFFFFLLGLCRFFFRGGLGFHRALFSFHGGFLVSAHGTAFVAASATAARLISSQGNTGSASQAGNAKACREFLQILWYSIVGIAEKEISMAASYATNEKRCSPHVLNCPFGNKQFIADGMIAHSLDDQKGNFFFPIRQVGENPAAGNAFRFSVAIELLNKTADNLLLEPHPRQKICKKMVSCRIISKKS